MLKIVAILLSSDTSFLRDCSPCHQPRKSEKQPSNQEIPGPKTTPALPPPVKFPPLGLLVKSGSQVPIAEAHCLIFVRENLPSLPAPDVCGWCSDDNQNFIYMELLDGPTLEQCWSDLDEDGKIDICQQLWEMVKS